MKHYLSQISVDTEIVAGFHPELSLDESIQNEFLWLEHSGIHLKHLSEVKENNPTDLFPIECVENVIKSLKKRASWYQNYIRMELALIPYINNISDKPDGTLEQWFFAHKEICNTLSMFGINTDTYAISCLPAMEYRSTNESYNDLISEYFIYNLGFVNPSEMLTFLNILEAYHQTFEEFKTAADSHKVISPMDSFIFCGVTFKKPQLSLNYIVCEIMKKNLFYRDISRLIKDFQLNIKSDATELVNEKLPSGEIIQTTDGYVLICK